MISQIFPQHSKDFEAIQSRIGKLVCSLSHDLYCFNGVPDYEDMGSLELAFTDSTFLTLRLSSDGQGVKAAIEPLSIVESFDLNKDAHCSWKRIVLTDDQPWDIFKKSRIVAIDALIEKWTKPPENTETLIGWVLRFETDNFVVYWNYGDEANILINMLPPTIDGVETRLEVVACEAA